GVVLAKGPTTCYIHVTDRYVSSVGMYIRTGQSHSQADLPMSKQTTSSGLPTPRPRATDRIRQTARELFYRRGIRAVGVDASVTQAGAAQPRLFRNTSPKDQPAPPHLPDT